MQNGLYLGDTTGARADFFFTSPFNRPESNQATGCRGQSSTFGASVPDQVFSRSVGAGQYFTASLNTAHPTTGAVWSATLNIVSGIANCGTLVDGGTQGVCVGSDASSTASNRAVFYNDTGAAQTAFTIVKGFGFNPRSGLFSLTTNVGPLPAGERCESAIALNGGAQNAVPLSSTTRWNDYSGTGTNCAGSSFGLDGPDVAYSYTGLGSNQRVTFTVTPSSSLDVSLSVSTSPANCAARRCGASSEVSGQGSPEQAMYVNRTASPMDVFAVVDGRFSTSAGQFGISATVDTSPMGDGCNTATPLVAGNTLVGETLVNFTNDYVGGTKCATTFPQPVAGLDRAYSFTVPALHQATISVTAENSTLDTVVSVVDSSVGCGNGVCVAGADNDSGGGGGVDTVQFSNTSNQPRTYFIIVDSYVTSSPATTFSIGATTVPIPPNDVCEFPGTPVTVSSNITGSMIGRANDYNWTATGSGCGFGTSWADAVHAVTMAPGQQLTATVTTTSGAWDPTILIADMASCAAAAPTCLASGSASTSIAVGSSERATFINTTSTARTVLVLVETSTRTGLGDYSLSITLTSPSYSLSSIGAACDDMSVASNLMLSGANVSTSILPVGFTATVLGQSATHYSVHTKGFAQFWPSAAGPLQTPIPVSNVAIPSAAIPNNFIAPFWDALEALPANGSRASALISGTAPGRRLTIEWSNWSFSSTAGPERLRFQAKLFETTNVIEFHYCSMENNGGNVAQRPNGIYATVGIEDSTGTVGVQSSFEVPSATVTGSGVRFTP